MSAYLSFSQFARQFHNNTICLEEIKRLKYPKGIICTSCRKITRHYRIKNRLAYGCIACRSHTYPLANTIFEKSSTPLRIWFFALFLMTHARGEISALQLQKELEVTYKTAWRMKRLIKKQMMYDLDELYPMSEDSQVSKVHKWVFFKHFEIAVIEKEE
jgi:transposase